MGRYPSGASVKSLRCWAIPSNALATTGAPNSTKQPARTSAPFRTVSRPDSIIKPNHATAITASVVASGPVRRRSTQADAPVTPVAGVVTTNESIGSITDKTICQPRCKCNPYPKDSVSNGARSGKSRWQGSIKNAKL